jgi:hypothetical protein
MGEFTAAEGAGDHCEMMNRRSSIERSWTGLTKFLLDPANPMRKFRAAQLRCEAPMSAVIVAEVLGGSWDGAGNRRDC